MYKIEAKTVALIMAAGSSERMGSEIPKPYMSLNGKPAIRRVMELFCAHPGIDAVRVVINRAHHPYYRKLTDGLALFPCVVGGRTRQESVRRGLESIARVNPERVLIHDAARPLASAELLDRVLAGLDTYPAVLPAVPVVDTLRKDGVLIARDGMMAAQTPQGFHFSAIRNAHARFTSQATTDDIALAEMAGLRVGVVEGERLNFKLTTPEDYTLMQTLTSLHSSQANVETRVGLGTDVHNFIPHAEGTPTHQRSITLCGVSIPSEMRLQGHSDADAGLHALVDAMLGAIGAGDIGQHFPCDDPQWKGADSSRFLIHAYQLLKARGGEIVNIDITLLCEKPKISPHRDAMQARIADLLKIDLTRVNVKATTTEKLGFLGRGEGLAAQAMVSVKVRA